jgi:signal transduction histidine kinase/CheY-like chemotaxis protein
LQSLGFGPAELDVVRAVSCRVRRIAGALFKTEMCDAILFDGAGSWFGSGWENVRDELPLASLIRLQSEVVWIPDILADPRFCGHPAFEGVRGCLGAAIQLETGERIGVLGAYLDRPAAYDAEQARLLQDLADLVGFECDRVRATVERDATIEKLRRSEQRLKIAVRSADLYVFEIDYQAQELVKIGEELAFFAEPQTYASSQEEGGLSPILPEDRHLVIDAWERQDRKAAPTDFEFRMNRRDKEVWVHAHNQLFSDARGPRLVVGSYQNITERKKAERALVEAKAAAEAANQAKSGFLATMSHEIRTPLNGVLGMAQAMAVDTLSPMQSERLDVIRQSGESLLAILNDMLDLSKIEAGKLELEEIAFDLGEIARGAHATFTALANSQGLSFGLDIEAARGVYLGDPTRLRQVLYNLISNALKFTEAGEIRVTAAYEAGELEIRVADTGIGMSDEALSGLFSKFAQADTSTTRKYGGTGLGLAICRQLADLMGGSIAATSREGQGSTFVFKIPMARIGEARTAAAQPERPAQGSLELRVLAAEDNSVNQLVLKTLLHQVGVEPVIVENGQLALEAWEASDWDVILMDVQMPVMDGPTATRAIRAREAQAGRPRTPIIALTANAMSHQLADYLVCGMDGHVTKPIDAQRLFEALQDALDARADETEEKVA